MPSPKTPRRPSKRREARSAPSTSRSVDLGTPLGPYDTNTVRDRIRQWQASGGGVVTADEIYVEVEEDSHRSRKTSWNDEKDAEYSDAGGAETGRRRREQGHGNPKDDVDEAPEKSAPKKRVVSDTHWQRKMASSSKAAETVETHQSNVATHQLLDDGIRVRPLESSSQERSRQHRAKSYTPGKASSPFDDGIRVYSTPPGSRQTSRNASGAERYDTKARCDDSDDSDATRQSDSSQRKRSSRRSKEPVRARPSKVASAYKSNDTSRHRKERTPENLPPMSESDAFSNLRVSTKSQRSNLLSHVLSSSKRIFSRPEPILAPTGVPAIETWLDGTPDPFVDGGIVPVEVLQPDKKARKENADEAFVIPADPNKIWDTLGPPRHEGPAEPIRGSSSRRRQREHAPTAPLHSASADPEAKSDDASSKRRSSRSGDAASRGLEPQESPTTLRRRGARKDVISPKADRQSSLLQDSSSTRKSLPLLPSSPIDAASDSQEYGIPPPLPRSTVRRSFPISRSHHLSTIASVETLNLPAEPSSVASAAENPSNAASWHQEDIQSELQDRCDPGSLNRTTSRTRSIKHSDLMSLLSMPGDESKSVRSTRSIRSSRSKLATATVADLLAEFEADEAKYMREVRTLVDGVIPVLLSCVLSKSDAAVAAGLFQPHGSAQDAEQVIKPIVNMGIALERLKSLHRRAPKHSSNALLTWAQGGLSVYADYIGSWRMGFQDVVVNLAAASDSQQDLASQKINDEKEVDEGLLPRNREGDVVDTNGERVDVAFLLKRPLVRLRHMAKTLRGLHVLAPSTEAANLAASYQALVITARNRSNEEHARLEDEAAAAIDPTRARDPKTLGPLAGVTIDGSMRVRARDFFGLTLRHSSAQQIDCRAELLLRDASADQGSGDVLICEVDGTGRWLLFPPVALSEISARKGDAQGEMIVMLRGSDTQDADWHELLSFYAEEEQAIMEWVQMLGLDPVPPRIQRSLSFLARHQREEHVEPLKASLETSVVAEIGRPPSPRELELPIGEQATRDSRRWNGSSLDDPPDRQQESSPRERHRLQKRPPASFASQLSASSKSAEAMQHRSLEHHEAVETNLPSSPIQVDLADTSPGTSGLRRAKAKRMSRHTSDLRALSPASLREDFKRDFAEDQTPDRSVRKSPAQARSLLQKNRASAPPLDLPIIPKVRKNSPTTTPTNEVAEEVDWPQESHDQGAISRHAQEDAQRLQGKSSSSPREPRNDDSPSPAQQKSPSIPDLSPAASQPFQFQRRSSSPLKHEYAPSSASASCSDSETSTVEHNEVTSISDDSSTDDELEGGDAPTPLVPLGALNRRRKVSASASLYTLPRGTLSPSSSASQTPYKTVPLQPAKAVKTIASIFCWSEKGSWESLFPDECSITITPGLIEAFEMSAAHSRAEPTYNTPAEDSNVLSTTGAHTSSQIFDPNPPKPLVALELTPLVPIRRGTALDISIRSPPTADSVFTAITNNNILFRSRSSEECEALYGLINQARINNPTYIALQNARLTSTYSSQQFTSPLAPLGAPSRRSWFGLGGSSGARSSYRARTISSPSVIQSTSSFSSAFSAFSALRRFRPSARFNIARSTITSRIGSTAESMTESSGSGASSPLNDNRIGVTNVQITLYLRAQTSRWDLLGKAHLTILRPTQSTLPLTPGYAATASGSVRGPRASDKRILVVRSHGKQKGETLLDVTLGEACFERIMGRGIAVSVWANGEVEKEGGVVAGRLKVYLMRFSGEFDTAYTFSLVGRPRF